MRKHHVLNAVQACPRPVTTPPRQARCFHTYVKPFNAAVIGGGITGMTAAWRLCQDPRCLNVTLYEKSPRLGGWMQSEKVEVKGGHVVFEYGPRTVRSSKYTSAPILDLLVSLGMEDEIQFINKDAPAAKNRFIYYPDHLVRMPGKEPGPDGKFSILETMSTLLSEPVFDGLLKGIITEYFKARPDISNDESVASFLSRRLDARVAENLASALCHGIYAGDVHKLSSEILLPIPRYYERMGPSITHAMLQLLTEGDKVFISDYLVADMLAGNNRNPGHLDHLRRILDAASVFTVRDGLAGITSAFIRKFKENSKIQVVTDAEITSLKRGDDSNIIISLQNGEKIENQAFDRAIATAPPTELSRMIEAGSPKDGEQIPIHTISQLRHLEPAVNVMVINLYYDQPDLIPHRGFGYLIPQSVPLEQNPERALGVIFGTETSQGQDTAPGTKLTIMMGGHWWDSWPESDIPTPEEAIAMSRRLLKRHLGIDETPAVASARYQRQAVPQYTVDHLQRMRALSDTVRVNFDSRLTLAGNYYGMHGVGLTSCVAQAYLAASYGVGSFIDRPSAGFSRGIAMTMEKEVGGIPTHPHRLLRLPPEWVLGTDGLGQ